MTVWSIARAKNELAELVKQAKTQGSQLIRTRRYPVVVVVSIRRWNAMLRRYPELEKWFWQKTIRHRRVRPSATGRGHAKSAVDRDHQNTESFRPKDNFTNRSLSPIMLQYSMP